MIFPPAAILDQLARDGVDLDAMQARYERLFPDRLDATSAQDLLWFVRFAVDRRKYLNSIARMDRQFALTGRPIWA